MMPVHAGRCEGSARLKTRLSESDGAGDDSLIPPSRRNIDSSRTRRSASVIDSPPDVFRISGRD